MTDQKIVFKSELFKIAEVEPNPGKKYQIVQKNPSVHVLPISDDSNVYLLSEYRFMLEKTVIQTVAGTIEENETPLVAAKRELKEEAGIIASQWEEIARIELATSVIKSKAYVFLARDLEIGTPSEESGEKIKTLKMPIREAVGKAFLGEINDALSIIGILMLDKLRKDKKI